MCSGVSQAATEVIEISKYNKSITVDNLIGNTVSLNGLWQKGHYSLIGVVTVIHRLNDKFIKDYIMYSHLG